jgi:hypothetical protein
MRQDEFPPTPGGDWLKNLTIYMGRSGFNTGRFSLFLSINKVKFQAHLVDKYIDMIFRRRVK